MTAHTSVLAPPGSKGDLCACAGPINPQFLQLLINPTSFSQHRSPPRHRDCFSLPLCTVLGSFWRIALWTPISNLLCDTGHFGTPLGDPSCIALGVTSTTAPRLCCIRMAVLGIAHFRIQTASYKIPQHCSCLLLWGTPALVRCLLGKASLWDLSPPSPGWVPFAHEISLLCSTGAAGPVMGELGCP